MITNGQYIKQYLIDAGSRGATISDIHKSRKNNPDVLYKRGTYSSFIRFFRWFIDLKWVEQTGEKEKAVAKGDSHPLSTPRIYYRITEKGLSHDDNDWSDPIAFAHPEWAGNERAKKYRLPTGKKRGRPRVGKVIKEKPVKVVKERKPRKKKVEVELTQQEKDDVIKEFMQIFGRRPTQVEMVELWTEEMKIKQKKLEEEGE